MKLIQSTSLLFILISSIGLTGCMESNSKGDYLSSTAKTNLEPVGHIESKASIKQEVRNASVIPSIVKTQIPLLPSLVPGSNALKTYSISAVRVPVKELLFKLAQMSSRDIDIDSTVLDGHLITINAIDKPLNKIIERIAEQAGLAYTLVNGAFSIKADLPEWRNYKVDYVNITKDSTDTIDMKLNVSSSQVSGSGATGGSSTSVTVKSTHKFWENLKQNIEILAQQDPLDAFRESDVVSKSMNESRARGDGRTSQYNSNGVLVGAGGSAAFTSAGNSVSSNGGFSSESTNEYKNTRAVNTLVNPEAGMISVYTTAKKHKAIKKYIDNVVQRVDRQVMIEATVVEVSLNDQYQAGINWSFFNDRMFGDAGGIRINSPFQGSSSGFTISTVDNSGSSANGIFTGDWNILNNINLLKTFGDSKVLSSPKIMAINNQTALLKVVKNEVYFTVDVQTTQGTTTASPTTTFETEINTVPIGFTMSVTPFVSDKGTITLNVRPTISTIDKWVEDPNPSLGDVQNLIPVVQEKEMSSVLQLRNKQTAIIGGLIEDRDLKSTNGLPWVSDVPVLGDFFSTRSDQTVKKELVVFIRPIIVKNPDVDNGDLNSVSRFLKTTND